MRPLSRARWPICAVALCCLSPSVLADAGGGKKKKDRSIDSCASFTQTDREDEDGVDFTVASSCDVKLSCGIKWSLTCAPGTKKAKTFREGAAFELDTGTSETATASTARCGHTGWEIAEITWRCEPVP